MQPQAIRGMGVDPQVQQAFASPQNFPQMPPDAARASTGMYSPGTDQMQPDGQQEPYQDPLRSMIESVNLADTLDDDKLNEIGQEASKGFEADLYSRRDWEQNLDEWTKLAKQTKEEKTFPWPKASNIKYPLLSTAAMQFAARAYPSLVPSDGQVVKAIVIGKDPTGSKQQKAERTGIYTSYQIMHEMDGWEEDMDKLLIMLPVVGVMFKKTYWDAVKKQNTSRLVMPKNLVVNYWTKNLATCERISEIIEMSPRLLKERQNAGIFLDIDLGSAPMPAGVANAPANDRTTPYTLIEQHTFLDLDDDGYEEPYIVTFHRESKKVLRIAARYDEKSILTNDDGEMVAIDPIQYYTKFGFIPNPDGSFYDIGFGLLLGPINDSVNTIINQLVDSGTINNLQGGFIGKGLRLKMGEQRFQPGEWKAVNATADDLKKQILPLPTKEPSDVLFKLMGALITSGKELASVAEIFTGKMPGQNTPATTTMATVEQGMKVFTAVYKRIYRALNEEFKKLYRLNEVYLDPQTYVAVMDTTVDPDDFKPDGYDICPGADPSAVSQSDKLLKAQALAEMLPMGILDPVQVVLRMLQAQEQPNYQQLLHPQVQQTGQPPQQPDPKAQELQMKMQAEQQSMQMEQQQMQMQAALQQRDQQFKQAMDAQKQQADLKFKAAELALKIQAQEHNTRSKMVEKAVDIHQQDQTHQQQMMHESQKHQQAMHHNEQNAQQQRETLKSQHTQTSKTGKDTQSRK